MASDPQTWADLQTAVADWTEQDFAAAKLQQFIAFGERVLNRVIFTPDRESALSLTAATQSTALPSDFWGFKTGPYVDGSPDVVLTRLEPGDLRATYPDSTTGTPAHYAVSGENLLLGPTPSASTAIKGTYYAVIPALGASQTTNWLLTDHPDVYLAAALVEAFNFHMDEKRAAFWTARLADKVEEINRSGRRRSGNSGPMTVTHSTKHISNIQA